MNNTLGYFGNFVTFLEFRTVLFVGVNVIYILVGLYLLIAKRSLYGLIFYIFIWAATWLLNAESRNFPDGSVDQPKYGLVDSFFLMAGLQVLLQGVYEFVAIFLRTIFRIDGNDDVD